MAVYCQGFPEELWSLVKKTVREVESGNGVLIFDDTIQEKVWTDDNEIINWYFDHSKNRAVKGVNTEIYLKVTMHFVPAPLVFMAKKMLKKDSNWFSKVLRRPYKNPKKSPYVRYNRNIYKC